MRSCLREAVDKGLLRSDLDIEGAVLLVTGMVMGFLFAAKDGALTAPAAEMEQRSWQTLLSMLEPNTGEDHETTGPGSSLFIAGVVLFVAAFFWLLTTHGPLAPVGVQIGSVVRADLTPSVFGIGTVDARLAYAVGPIAPGRVLRVLVDQGDAVKAGQLLAEMDPVDHGPPRSGGEERRRRVRARRCRWPTRRWPKQQAAPSSPSSIATAIWSCFRNTSSASRRWITAATRPRRPRRPWRRRAPTRRLQRRTSGALDAESRGVGSLRDSLRLVSPVDGVIVSREAEPGTTVVAGQAVLRLVVPESLWVRARVDQSRAAGRAGGAARQHRAALGARHARCRAGWPASRCRATR